ncbi:MAG: recombinase family protein, partial [bacterium]|nr:recombinase family protein [bacterium]
MASRRSSAVAKLQPATRCAIYCRKSTSQGLEQEFNSLDAQREAAESYIASQQHDNWIALPDRYDDGGFSAGTTDRPALKRLRADIKAGQIDCVIVYKFDRLSRRMLDFFQLLDEFEQHSVSFVSVSQRFDTSTPVGKMTMNILLSFAEFERLIIADRTRDKIQAARRRGRWTGGPPPLGYDTVPEGGRIVVNKIEAEQVKAIFQLYVDTPSLIEVSQELNRRGWRQKAWTAKTGRPCGGRPWNNSSV